MSFDPTWLFLSLIPAGIGFVLFVYGKKQERWSQLAWPSDSSSGMPSGSSGKASATGPGRGAHLRASEETARGEGAPASDEPGCEAKPHVS